MFLYLTRSLIIKINGIVDPSLDQVIHAFKEKLAEFQERIEGIRMYNFKEKKYLITFKQADNPMMGEAKDIVHALCSDGYTTEDRVTIQSEIPQQPSDMITLYLVPFEMTETHLSTLEKRGWGKIEKINFGKLKHYQNIKNGYVNIFIKDPNYLAIQNQVNIMGHWLSVTTPYNRHLPMCQFCKIRGHGIETCPKLQKNMNKKRKKTELKQIIQLKRKHCSHKYQ